MPDRLKARACRRAFLRSGCPSLQVICRSAFDRIRLVYGSRFAALSSFSLLLGLSAHSAVADDNWHVGNFPGEAYRAGFICPSAPDDNPIAPTACIAFGCEPDQEPSLRIVMLGGEMPHGSFPATFFVDGAKVETIEFTRRGTETSVSGWAPIDATARSLIRKFATGETGALDLTSSGRDGAVVFPLRGAGEAISQALSACRVPTPS